MANLNEAAQVDLVEMTAGLVSAYLTNNHLAPNELVVLIKNVHVALNGLSSSVMREAAPQKPTPAAIKKSITREHLISFEDGKPYKTLRRHLTLRGLSSEAYREKWGLPSDYPMTSPGYSEQRSQLARELGLGQQRRRPEAPAVGADAEPTPSAKPRGRRTAAETESA